MPAEPVHAPPGTPPRVLVSLATYHEVDNIRPLAEAIRTTVPYADVLVVDDNSPDGTGRLADEMAKAHAWVKVLHRAGKQGLGTAIMAAMKQAVAGSYDY